MSGVIVITGPRGIGKTTLASTFSPPGELDKVYYHDAENSANNIRDQLQKAGLDFGRYVDLEARFTDLPSSDDLLATMNRATKGEIAFPWATAEEKSLLISYYKYILSDLDENLTPGKYKVYIHDPLGQFEAGMVAWAETHLKELGLMPKPYKWGKFWLEGVYALYRNLFAAIRARGVETIILCSHLKDATGDKGRKILGKVVPRGKPMLYLISSLMLWLVSDLCNADGAPAALVLKERMGELTPDPESLDGWGRKRGLPRRIPHCTWADVHRYMRDGCDFANPKEGEVPSQAEEDMISELLTDTQMRLMIAIEEREKVELQSQMPDLLRMDTGEGKLETPGMTEEAKAQGSKTAMSMLMGRASVREVMDELGLSKPIVLKAKKELETST